MIKIKVNNSYFSIPEEIEIDGFKYQYQTHLGGGGNSSVEEFVSLEDGRELACKIIPLENRTDFHKKEAQRVHTEVKLLKSIKHQHVINYIASKLINIHKLLKDNKACNIRALFVLMEKADTTLKEFICEKRVDYITYSGQILGLAGALTQLHKQAIHRDLKPENILVVDSNWVISDFGLGKFLDNSSPDITSQTKAIGPKYWLSPEAYSRYVDINENRKEIDCKSDIYQMCAIFWFIINRKHPSGILTYDDFDGPKEIFDILEKGLQHDTSRRYSSTDEFYQTLRQAILKE